MIRYADRLAIPFTWNRESCSADTLGQRRLEHRRVAARVLNSEFRELRDDLKRLESQHRKFSSVGNGMR